MRNVEKIREAIREHEEWKNSPNAELRLAAPVIIKGLEDELRAALTASIPLDRLEEICQAERYSKQFESGNYCYVIDKYECKDYDVIECVICDLTIEKKRRVYGGCGSW